MWFVDSNQRLIAIWHLKIIKRKLPKFHTVSLPETPQWDLTRILIQDSASFTGKSAFAALPANTGKAAAFNSSLLLI
ncbi:hypothetical protein DZS_23600 [Dickeya ananatis]